MISPIPKRSTNDPRIPLNYQGISLLPVSGKLFTAAISGGLLGYCEQSGILADEQNGFRPDRSTLDHIFSLHNICFTTKQLKQDTYLTFIDYQKAFDYVEHEYLYHKLFNYNINGKIYNSIKNIYNHPHSCVQLNGQLSPWFEVTAGVQQGDSSSPLLFALFINDLADEVRNAGSGVCMGGEQVSLLMYADDRVLISDNEKGAQKQLDVMSAWCGWWGMKINARNPKYCM